jgi:tetratricopeptide (TPR) repeat protein
LPAVVVAAVLSALVLSGGTLPYVSPPGRPDAARGAVVEGPRELPGLDALGGAPAWLPATEDPADRRRRRREERRRTARRLSLTTIGGSTWYYHDSEIPPLRHRLGEAWRKIRGEEGADPEIWSSFPDFEFERLTLLFPESPTGRSFSEYAEIRGGTYFGYRWLYAVGDFKYDPEREIPGFLAWVERYPGHPGLDDACYRLARCYGIRGDLAEALRWFKRAQIAPDGDMRWNARWWSVLLLDAVMSEEELKGYVYREGDAEAAYSLGLRRFREGDFAGAESWMEWAVHGLPSERAESVGEQITAVRALADLARRVEEALGEEALAKAMYALGRRQYHDAHLYESVLWGDRPKWNRRSILLTSGILTLWGHDGTPETYRRAFRAFTSKLQARRTFLGLAETCPTSSIVADARFSAATALAHTASGHPAEKAVACPAAVKRQVAREYRQLARDFPDSRLADDALYHAGLLSGQREAYEEILRLHPDGDFRAKAAARLEKPVLPAPTLADVPRLIDDLAEGPRWRDHVRADRAARDLERILGVCVHRIPDESGAERRRAIDELREWFRAAGPRLEFDRDAGGYVLR